MARLRADFHPVRAQVAPLRLMRRSGRAGAGRNHRHARPSRQHPVVPLAARAHERRWVCDRSRPARPAPSAPRWRRIWIGVFDLGQQRAQSFVACAYGDTDDALAGRWHHVLRVKRRRGISRDPGGAGRRAPAASRRIPRRRRAQVVSAHCRELSRRADRAAHAEVAPADVQTRCRSPRRMAMP